MMKQTILDAVRAGRTVVFDGAIGTELAARDIAPDAASSVDQADTVLAIQRAYREAGADVIITNTFGANRPSLARRDEAERLDEYIAAACRIARDAAGAEAWVAGDIGPTGELLEPYGSATPEQMRVVFEECARALVGEGVDLLIVESMSDATELALAVAACRAAAPDGVVAACVSFDPVRDGLRSNTGVAPADAARAMIEAGADIAGANCGTISPEQMADVVQAYRDVADVPILVQPNAGLPELRDGKTAYNLRPQAFATALVGVQKAGARLLGGCCGTGPEHIRALRQALDAAGV
jgi:5-methyltetrahydrofolate--homocysteine methyltransferase